MCIRVHIQHTGYVHVCGFHRLVVIAATAPTIASMLARVHERTECVTNPRSQAACSRSTTSLAFACLHARDESQRPHNHTKACVVSTH